jgi:gamma-glutamyltranspeptidase/glutathione hydrolase
MLTRYSSNGAVAAANHLAASAGVDAMRRGGNAVDAIIAAAAVMAVVGPDMCGLGGDLFALVSRAGEPPAALNASGRSGSGADADPLRAEGHRLMPFVGEIRAVTVPGCVDGLIALHERFATIELGELFGDARGLAEHGFPASPTLAAASAGLPPDLRKAVFGATEPVRAGQRLRLTGVAAVLGAVAESGRAGFYESDPGQELLELGAGEFSEEDLRAGNAEWVAALGVRAFERRLWSAPPNSQGYLALSGAWVADQVGVPDHPDDERWAFLLIEAARQAAFDRVQVLHEHADGASLVSHERLAPRAYALGELAARDLSDDYREGGTTCICAVDRDRTGVSLIMSNAAGFGSHLALERHGIFLHNRGLGFSLDPGHPAEYGPRRRPPHTLTPMLVTGTDDGLEVALGTMGGDAQPQILLQLLARLLVSQQPVGDAIEAARWSLMRTDASPFHVWHHDGPPSVLLEHGAPRGWLAGLRRRGYDVLQSTAGDRSFGHAQIIRVTGDGLLAGASDPRSGAGAIVGF